MPGIGQSGASPAPQHDSVGVIITMPPDLADELGRWRSRYAKQDTIAVPAHITLVSGRALVRWADAAQHVREVARNTTPFKVSLRGTGTFLPVSPVVFLNLVDGVQECRDLHELLLEGPVEHLLDFGFYPHLTIAHDLDAETMTRAQIEMADFAADFEVASIGLYDYADDGWVLREELSLGGKAKP